MFRTTASIMFQVIKNKIFSVLYSEKVRPIFKRLKALLRPIAFLRDRSVFFRWKAQYKLFRGDSLLVFVGKHEAKFYVQSFSEFTLFKRLYGESRTIKKFLSRIKIGDTAYDIGANVGVYALFLAKAVGENGFVIAFEPEKLSRERLKLNLKLNELKNVKIFDKGLANERVVKELTVGGDFLSGRHSFLEVNKEFGPIANTQNTEVVIGDQFIKNQSLPVPNVLKIDVEGMEYDVLQGLSETLKNPECRLVFCEIHFAVFRKMGATDTLDKIKQLLKESGFINLEWLDKSHLLASKT